ncbi:MAG: tetratricopeptide repeat protein [Pseudomonadota bacterium]
MTQSSAAKQRPGYDEGVEVTLDEALELAKGHHFEGNFMLAERTYRDILRAVPDHFPTIHFLGVMLYQTTVFDEALIYMEKSIQAEPDDKQCWNNYGAVLMELGRNDEAIEAYDKSLVLDPEFGDAMNNKGLALWRSGQLEEAQDLIENSLKADPDNGDARINLGIIYSTQKKYQEALEIWQNLAEAHPEIDKIWINWGNTLRDMGRFAESEAKCREALELNSNNPEAHNNLANVLRDRGKPEAALEHYKKATDLRPEYFEAHTNTSIALSDQNRFEEAAVAGRYAVAFKRDDPRANSALSLALRNIGQYPEARAASLRAIKADPDNAEPYLDLAEVNFMSDFLNDAEAALQEALKREPNSARSLKKLADIYDKMNDYDRALEAVDEAIKLAPDMPIMWMRKASILQMMNNMSDAFDAMDKAIELSPTWHLPYNTKAEMLITVNENEHAKELAQKAISLNDSLPGPHATLMSLIKVKSEDEPEFQALLKLKDDETKLGVSGATVLNYAISDAYEQLKDYDAAFKHLKKANDYKRKIIPFNPRNNVELVQGIKARFTSELMESFEGKGFKSDVPVFIVGMPRSGTTLTEQIISSHPDVYGAGELTEIAKIRENLGGLSEDNLAEFGEAYVEAVKAKDKSGKALRVTDKMPGNYTNMGIITAILPNAKIIHCRRNPIDTCLSCYKQNFGQGQYWSYNLEELAEEYNRYLEVMSHWRSVMPDRFIEINYEETVGNFEEQARMLIDYVGLDWDDACLEPHKQKRAVLTASKAQVTKPIYKTSVEKWKRYEKHLQPLVDGINMDMIGK